MTLAESQNLIVQVHSTKLKHLKKCEHLPAKKHINNCTHKFMMHPAAAPELLDKPVQHTCNLSTAGSQEGSTTKIKQRHTTKTLMQIISSWNDN